jgi:hypothetical protein
VGMKNRQEMARHRREWRKTVLSRGTQRTVTLEERGRGSLKKWPRKHEFRENGPVSRT